MFIDVKALQQQLIYERFKHVSIMYIVAVSLFLFSTIPHKWWIFVTVAILSVATEPGLIVQRTIARSKGTLMALILMVPLLYVLQLNYRLVPVLMVGAAVLMVTSFANQRRYDISIFLLTIVIFMLEAQGVLPQGGESPLEAVMNRGICTALGILIVLGSDYFLFDAYGYSQKLYALRQVLLCETLKATVKNIQSSSAKHQHTILFIEKLRDQLNDVYVKLEISSENMLSDLKIEAKYQAQVEAFHLVVWDLRRIVFAYCFSELILKSKECSQKNSDQFQALFMKAESLVLQTA